MLNDKQSAVITVILSAVVVLLFLTVVFASIPSLMDCYAARRDPLSDIPAQCLRMYTHRI